MKVNKHLTLDESMDSIKKVVEFENDNVDVHADMDVVMTDAYDDDIKAEEHLEEVKTELAHKNDDVAVDTIEEPTLTVDNMYTAVLTLNEDLEDFKLVEDGRSHAAARGDEDDRYEEYLAYDMARFVSGLCGGEDWPKPLSPIGRRMRRFQSGSRDQYKGTVDGEAEANVGIAQVVPNEKYVTLHAQRSLKKDELIKFFNGDVSRANRVYRSELGYISPDSRDYELLDRTSPEYLQFLNSGVDTSKLDSASAFNDIREACDIYELEYTNPVPKRSLASHWDYSMKVIVPTDTRGLPMTLEEYFGQLRDAGNPYFVGLTDEEILYKILPKDFVKTYLNYKNKVEAEQNSMAAEAALEKAIRKASRDGTTPLEVFRDELDRALDNIPCDKAAILAKFDAEFADDYEDEE